MQYIFAKASEKGSFQAYPYQLAICLPESKSGWVLNGTVCKTAEDWLEAARRQLLRLGIQNVQCISLPADKTRKEAFRFHFFFDQEAQLFQFQIASTPDRTGNFVRRLTADTPSQSTYQEENLLRFLKTNEILHGLIREDPRNLIITTSLTHDDLIIAMEIAKKSFDMRHQPKDTPKTPYLCLPAHTAK